MSPKQINVAFRNLFNGHGLEVNGFKIKAESPFVANIKHEDNTTVINFGPNKPSAEIKRIITFKAYIEQIVLGEESGSVKLKNFPDIHFSYEDSVLSLLTDNISFGDDSVLEEQIDKKYCDKSRNKIAKKCLQYAREWATICSQAGYDFKDVACWEKRTLRKSCYDFVKTNIEEDMQGNSAFVTFALFFVVIPAIISWVVHRILDELFSN